MAEVWDRSIALHHRAEGVLMMLDVLLPNSNISVLFYVLTRRETEVAIVDRVCDGIPECPLCNWCETDQEPLLSHLGHVRFADHMRTRTHWANFGRCVRDGKWRQIAP